MRGGELEFGQLPLDHSDHTHTRRAAALTCARAAVRGVFPTAELPMFLAMLGLTTPRREAPMNGGETGGNFGGDSGN